VRLHARQFCHKPSDEAAFTLLELLAVVAILALLMALCLPSLAEARKSAGRAACQSTLSQWAKAVIMYADANYAYLPRRGQGAQPTVVIDRPEDWFNALPPLMKTTAYRDLVSAQHMPQPGQSSLYMCPQALNAGDGFFFAYAMNMRLSTWNAAKPDRIDRVAPPAVQVFMADGPGNYCSALPSKEAYSPVARHLGRVKISFLDGHVNSFPEAYVGCRMGDPRHGDVQWIVPGSSWPGPIE